MFVILSHPQRTSAIGMTLFTTLVALILFAIAFHLFGRKTILAFEEAFVFLFVILDLICISGRSLPICRSFFSLASLYHLLCCYWKKNLRSHDRVVNHSRDRLRVLSIHILACLQEAQHQIVVFARRNLSY